MKQIYEDNKCWTKEELFQALKKTTMKAINDNPDRSTKEKRIEFINQICRDFKNISLPVNSYVCTSDTLIEEFNLGYGSVFLWVVFRNDVLRVNVYSTINDLSIELAKVMEDIDKNSINALEIDTLRKRCNSLSEENKKLKEKYSIALEAKQVLQELRD